METEKENQLSLKFGARTYTVLEQPQPGSNESDEEIQGFVDYFKSQIVLNSSLSPDAKEETLIHEILHVILDRQTLELLARKSSPKELVENLVTYLTPRVHAFLRENSDFLRRFER